MLVKKAKKEGMKRERQLMIWIFLKNILDDILEVRLVRDLNKEIFPQYFSSNPVIGEKFLRPIF